MRRLKEFPRRVEKRVLRKSIRAGGNPFLKTARSSAPRRNGLFKRSLALKVKVYPGGTVVAIIGQRKNKRFNKAKLRLKKKGGISGAGELVPIHLVENAVKAHTIPGPIRLGRSVVRNVRHPGHAGSGFLARAAATAQPKSQIAFQRKAEQEITNEARNLP